MKGRNFILSFIFYIGVFMKTVWKILLLCAAGAGLYWFAFYRTPEEKEFARAFASAQSGDVQSALKTAEYYAKGIGVKQNGAQAAEWYRRAAVEGDASAAYELAELYIAGDALETDLEEALAYLQLAARAGEPRAQRELARFYGEGLAGLPVHPGEALFWRFMAAQNGDAASAQMLEKSRAENPDLYAEVKALEEDLAAAQAGNGEARLRVARAYEAGKPVLTNNEEAARWLTPAWEENHLPQAAFELSALYREGAGVAQDLSKASELLGAAAGAAYPPAQYALGEAAYKAAPPNYADAFAWFSNAAAGGFPAAQYMTGFMLMQGQGTAKSVPLAVKFFRDAAEQNHAAAQYVLGQIYVKGLGVAADKRAGNEWLQKAADNGNPDARALLETGA